VTVYVCAPAVVVFSAPCGAEAPFESVHDAIPGPPAPSVQENDVATTAPKLNVWPLAGAEIDATGAAGGGGAGATV